MRCEGKRVSTTETVGRLYGCRRTIEFVESDASVRVLDEAQGIEPGEVRRQLRGRKEETTIQTADLIKWMRA